MFQIHSQAIIATILILVVCNWNGVYAWVVVVDPVRMNPTNTRQLHPIRTSTRWGDTTTTPIVIGPLHASAEGTGGNNKNKRKRRRKKQPAIEVTTTTDPQVGSSSSSSPSVREKATVIRDDIGDIDDDDEPLTPQDIATIADVARFEFQKDKEFSMGIASMDAATTTNPAPSTQPANAIPLPDIKEARKRKQMEEELAKVEQEQEENKVRIKRSDKEAFRKLLEQQPFADADDSYFEEEEYGPISALLGERAKPFLSIPSGPLQVGHFIGALGIVLMAFVEYPGFPLTNLPTPLRDCLQGGLGTVYAINTALAVLAVFKAKERGQSAALWAAKTFSVGGLAYDQLTQLPTLEEVERSKSVKGKRALKNRKKQ